VGVINQLGGIVRNKWLLVLVLSLVAVGLMAVLFGCGSTDNSAAVSSDSTTAAAAEQATSAEGASDATEASASSDTTVAFSGQFDGEVGIGALGSMTGAGAMGGVEQIWAQQKAIDDINAKGGVVIDGKHVKLVLKVVDDQSDSSAGAAAVEKLIKVEGVKLILSTQVTPINLAAAVVAEKYQALYQQVITWTTIARENNWKWCPDLFFAPGAGGVGEVPFFIADKLTGADQPKNWGVLTEDNADGQALGDGVKAVAKNHPYVNIAVYQTYTPGTKDYSSVILKFKQANCDAIVSLISPSDGITFVKQMKEMDFAPKLMMGWKGFWPQQFKDGLGADANYILHDGFWSEDMGTPGSKELGEAYKASHDGSDSVSIGLPYAAVQILAMAIERAQSTDPAMVRDEIYGGTFKGTTMGDVTYDEQGVADISPLGLQWIDGNRVIIYPDHGNTLQLMKSWSER
jgi:branched-chain amino acid transport system substrate-binding protein